jgi:hypothetical protein
LIGIFLFYDQAQGKQAPLAFSKEFKHLGLILYDGDKTLLFHYDDSGINYRVLNTTNLGKLITKIHLIPNLSAFMAFEVTQKLNLAWYPMIPNSCNKIFTLLAGVDVGFTFNPRHLWSKMLKYKYKSNYDLLVAWRRSYGILWREKQTE